MYFQESRCEPASFRTHVCRMIIFFFLLLFRFFSLLNWLLLLWRNHFQLLQFLLNFILGMDHIAIGMINFLQFNCISCFAFLVFIFKEFDLPQNFVDLFHFLLPPIYQRNHGQNKDSQGNKHKPKIVVFDFWQNWYLNLSKLSADMVELLFVIFIAGSLYNNFVGTRTFKLALKNILYCF